MTCSGLDQIVYIKRNDTLPTLSIHLTETDSSGTTTDVDLTGASIKFVMINEADSTVKVNAAAIITDATGGLFQYEWSVGDTDVAGAYLGEFEITFSGGGKQTVPADDSFKIKIREDYDNA